MGTTSYTASGAGARMQASLRDNLQLATRGVETLGRALGDVAGLTRGVQTLPLRDMLGAVGLAGLPMPSLARARACRLPECDCPSPDLGAVRRVVDRGERVTIAVRLRNTTDRPREFALDAGPLVSQTGEQGGAVDLEPAVVSLQPGEIAVVKVSADASKHRTGVDYDTRLRIRAKGCDDLFLGVAVHVAAEVETAPLVDLHCCCTTGMRPLRWYHHYYCDPPAKDSADRPNDPQTHRPVG